MMKRKTIGIVLFLFCISLCSTVLAQDLGKIAEANISAAKGQAFYDKSRYEEAVAPLEKAIEIRPEHGRAHYYLALTYIKLEQKEKAVVFLQDYLARMEKTNEWLGSMDKEYIAKCQELLATLKKTND